MPLRDWFKIKIPTETETVKNIKTLECWICTIKKLDDTKKELLNAKKRKKEEGGDESDRGEVNGEGEVMNPESEEEEDRDYQEVEGKLDRYWN